MAHSTLSVLSVSEFPQIFDRYLARLDKMVSTAIAHAELTTCHYEAPLGSCDHGFLCSDRATVHDLATEQEFCLKHYRKVRQ